MKVCKGCHRSFSTEEFVFKIKSGQTFTGSYCHECLSQSVTRAHGIRLGDIRLFTSQGRVWVQWKGRVYSLGQVLMSAYLNRAVTEYEVVHHRDENPYNNSRDNLELMTRSDHTKMHVGRRMSTST